MSAADRWLCAVLAAIVTVALFVGAVELLALYGGRPIVNNPQPVAAKPLRINTLYVETTTR